MSMRGVVCNTVVRESIDASDQDRAKRLIDLEQYLNGEVATKAAADFKIGLRFHLWLEEER